MLKISKKTNIREQFVKVFKDWLKKKKKTACVSTCTQVHTGAHFKNPDMVIDLLPNYHIHWQDPSAGVRASVNSQQWWAQTALLEVCSHQRFPSLLVHVQTKGNEKFQFEASENKNIISRPFEFTAPLNSICSLASSITSRIKMYIYWTGKTLPGD